MSGQPTLEELYQRAIDAFAVASALAAARPLPARNSGTTGKCS